MPYRKDQRLPYNSQSCSNQNSSLLSSLQRFIAQRFGYNVTGFQGAVAFIGILILWMSSSCIAALICNIIGYVYPCYKTVKAIESTKKDDDTEWLMYWVVFSSFSCVEFFSDILLSWFPFYFLIKCIFLLWCMAPISYNGSKLIYNKLIRPWVLKNENKIDEVFGIVSNSVDKVADAVNSDQAKAISGMVASTVQNTIANSEHAKAISGMVANTFASPLNYHPCQKDRDHAAKFAAHQLIRGCQVSFDECSEDSTLSSSCSDKKSD